MEKLLLRYLPLLFLFTCLAYFTAQAGAATALTTCTELTTGKQSILPSSRADCRANQAKAIWQLQIASSNSSAAPLTQRLVVCTSKRPEFTYQRIKEKCARYQNTSIYSRAVTMPQTLVIKNISPRSSTEVVISLVDSSGNETNTAPIVYYLVTDLISNTSWKVSASNPNTIYLGDLSPATQYQLIVAAVNVDGTSPYSQSSPEVRTYSRPEAVVSAATPDLYKVGDLGPGGGIIFYVSSRSFASPGSTCNTSCKYLEVAPSTWQHGVIEEDLTYTWSLNGTDTTGQDLTTPSTEGRVSERSLEKANWRIGSGFNNTRIMKVAGAQSDAQAAVLAYGGDDSSVGQWFIPSLNEINELCKFARGQTTGDPSVACTNDGWINDSVLLNPVAGGFGEAIYWTSSERDAARAWLFNLRGGRGAQSAAKFYDIQIRPIRAL